MKIKQILFAALLFAFSVSHAQTGTARSESIEFVQIKTDTLFGSNQIISLLVLDASLWDKYELDIAYSQTDLIRTSDFGTEAGAAAAINGGFFSIKNGGSVTYLEDEDSVISGVSNGNPVFNGAVVIKYDNTLLIDTVKPVKYYEESKDEKAVLVTGPLLLINSAKVDMPDKSFTSDRHPRTCMCTGNDEVMLITIDGRREEVEGMSLYEVQDYLLSLGCVDAVNLDGGGSSTMWINGRGVVNYPSDATGERPVANAILILKK